MNWVVKKVTAEGLEPLFRLAQKEHVQVHEREGEWFAAISEDGKTALGFVNLLELSPGNGRCRHDFVCPEFRKQGVYRSLFEKRMERAKELLYCRLTAYSTPASRPEFLRAGFWILNVNMHGIAYMEKRI